MPTSPAAILRSSPCFQTMSSCRPVSSTLMPTSTSPSSKPILRRPTTLFPTSFWPTSPPSSRANPSLPLVILVTPCFSALQKESSVPSENFPPSAPAPGFKPMPPLIPAIPAARFSTPAARSLALTPSKSQRKTSPASVLPSVPPISSPSSIVSIRRSQAQPFASPLNFRKILPPQPLNSPNPPPRPPHLQSPTSRPTATDSSPSFPNPMPLKSSSTANFMAMPPPPSNSPPAPTPSSSNPLAAPTSPAPSNFPNPASSTSKPSSTPRPTSESRTLSIFLS